MTEPSPTPSAPSPHSRGQALVSLHDVTPAHEARVFAAIDHLRGLGVDALSLLVVPDFHHRAHLAHAPAFCRRLLSVLGPRDEILLHGFWHLADGKPRHGNGKLHVAGRQLVAKVATAGEGEFQALGYAEARDRLVDGLEVLADTLDVRPDGFVAPAWLQEEAVRRACRDVGLSYCEDHLFVHDLRQGRRVLAPALSMASRSWWRRLGSVAAAQLGGRLLPLQPVVRLAVHPNDYGHPALVASIAQVVRRWQATHTPVNYREALQGG